MPKKKRAWWPLVRRILLFSFIALVVWLLISKGRTIEWTEVGAAFRRLDPATLLAAAGLAALSHLLYSCFDVLGRVYTRHPLPAPRVMAVGFTSYVFNLNLGALIGGLAFRFRLYSRLGLKRGLIARVYTFSLITNWLGYLFLAGCVFAARALELPEHWKIGAGALQLVGAALLAAVAAYLGACGFAKKRDWHFRGAHLHLPSLRMAAVQFGLSTLNWLVIASVIFVLLGGKAAFVTVLAIMLAAAIAGVVTHIPAGLGVIEAVFLTFLAGTVPEGQLLAALLAYRGIYYLAPLALAIGVYLFLETRAATAAKRG